MRNEQPIGSLDDPHDKVYTLDDYRKDPEFVRRVRVIRPDYEPQQPGGPEKREVTVMDTFLLELARFLALAIALSGGLLLLFLLTGNA